MIKIYLISAIAVLMLITSMGIFGYLSKAHLDQNIASGDVQAKVSLIDEKIKIERENIANAQQVIKQMDAAVNGVIATGDQEVKLRDGSTQVRSAAERSLQIRRSQSKDRAALISQIEEAQARIVKLQEEAAPIRAEMREVEAKVGPIKYIAELIYGDNSDANLLEKAVTWVIIIIVLVFDPLAVILLLASQYSFQWIRQEKERLEEQKEQGVEEFFTRGKLVARGLDADEEARRADEANAKIAEIEKDVDVDSTLASLQELESNEQKSTVEDQNIVIEEVERAVEKELEDDEIINSAHDDIKEAMRQWKEANPDDSLKHQRRLFERGAIKTLPWENHLKAEADYSDNDAALEAAKWAQEQLEESKKKDSDVDGERRGQADQANQGRIEGYVQNSEQNESTIWQRVKKAKE
jgi:hypothetical protein